MFHVLDTSCPLMTASQESHGIVSLPVSFSSPAIVEVADNLRAKIYSIFCQLGELNDCVKSLLRCWVFSVLLRCQQRIDT